MKAFDPLAHRAFRWPWIALVVSSGGMWMQALGAQWFLVSQPDGAAYVALVQTALTLPVALLALPAGVLADNLNRRSLLLAVQFGTLPVGVALTFLMLTGELNPRILLALTALVGSGFALS